MRGDGATYELDVFDAYSYLIIGSISSLTSLLMLLAHLGWKELRRQPGDLILMISLSELGLSVHYFLSGLRTSWITSHYEDNSLFCKANSYLAMAAANADVFYNLCFLIHMMISLHNSVKTTLFMPKFTFHLVTLGLTALVVYKGKPGRNPYGTCSTIIEPNSLKYGTVVLSTVMLFSIYVYFKTKRDLRLIGAQASLLRRDFRNYQGSMILIFIVTALGIIASLQGQYQGVLAQTEESKEFWYGHSIREVIFYVCKLGNTSKVLMPAVLFLIRIRDPLIQKHVFDLLRKLGFLPKLSLSETETSVMSVDDSMCLGDILELNDDLWRRNSTSSRSSRSDSSLLYNRESALRNELLTFDTEDNAWMSLLPSLLKQGLARTFTVCACYFHPSRRASLSSFIQDNATDSLDNFVTFKIRETDVMNKFGLKESISDCQVTFYYCSHLDRVMSTHYEKVNFWQSLNPKLNSEAIKKAGKESGGNSGELFIRSFDGKLIIKTITVAEFKVFSGIIPKYCDHLVKNPQSAIAKIFCLYSVEVTGTGKTVYAIVMENVLPFHDAKPLRTYDLKGSTYSRKVLGSFQDTVNNSHHGTLKDMDFINIERSLPLSDSSQRKALMKALFKDCKFFSKHKIIDYSLLVGVYDASDLALDLHGGNNPRVFVSVADRGAVYSLGIIDYFQLYNWSKSTERFLKKIKTCSPNLETSSQPPGHYRDRFLKFIGKSFTYS